MGDEVRINGYIIKPWANLQGAKLQRAKLQGSDLQGADLQRANLQWVDLQGANLQGANLLGANLQGANLQGADLDFSCWPLYCGSLNVILCDRLKAQLLYHTINAVGVGMFTEKQIEFANTFHRVVDGGVPHIAKND